MANSTTRLGLAEPVGTDAVSEYRTAITTNATTLDAAVTITQGTLVSRPAGSYYGQTYYATDTKQWSVFIGSAWQIIVDSDTRWQSITLPANWGVLSGFYTPAIRAIGDHVFLSGSAKNNTGSTASFSVTIPSNCAPAADVNMPAVITSTPPTLGIVQVVTTSLVVAGITVPNGNAICFDGLSYRLT